MNTIKDLFNTTLDHLYNFAVIEKDQKSQLEQKILDLYKHFRENPQDVSTYKNQRDLIDYFVKTIKIPDFPPNVQHAVQTLQSILASSEEDEKKQPLDVHVKPMEVENERILSKQFDKIMRIWRETNEKLSPELEKALTALIHLPNPATILTEEQISEFIIYILGENFFREENLDASFKNIGWLTSPKINGLWDKLITTKEGQDILNKLITNKEVTVTVSPQWKPKDVIELYFVCKEFPLKQTDWRLAQQLAALERATIYRSAPYYEICQGIRDTLATTGLKMSGVAFIIALRLLPAPITRFHGFQEMALQGKPGQKFVCFDDQPTPHWVVYTIPQKPPITEDMATNNILVALKPETLTQPLLDQLLQEFRENCDSVITTGL
jgi:hypothetical protein